MPHGLTFDPLREGGLSHHSGSPCAGLFHGRNRVKPQQAIAQLDRAIARYGQTVTLRRGTATAPSAQATVKAHVRGFKPDELIGGIDQNDSKVILSPSGLAGWPGGAPIKGDWITIDGRVRSIVAAEPVKMADVLVRVELQVKG